MRLFSIMFFNKPSDASIAPVKLAESVDLSDLAFFKRGTAKELMTFFGRQVVQRAANNVRLSITKDEHVAHLYVADDGLSCVVLTDKEYPVRVAFDVLRQSIALFNASRMTERWRELYTDTVMCVTGLDSLLRQYQQPQEIDKILKIQQDVDEVKDIMIKNLGDMLRRGEKIEDIVAKSNELSTQSKTFVKESKKLNGCCR